MQIKLTSFVINKVGLDLSIEYPDLTPRHVKDKQEDNQVESEKNETNLANKRLSKPNQEYSFENGSGENREISDYIRSVLLSYIENNHIKEKLNTEIIEQTGKKDKKK